MSPVDLVCALLLVVIGAALVIDWLWHYCRRR